MCCATVETCLRQRTKTSKRLPIKKRKEKKKSATKIMTWVTSIKKMGFIYEES